MPQVLITRQLEANNLLVDKLSVLGVRLVGVSFVDFTPVPITKLPIVDWVFFYSKQAFRFFMRNPKAALYLSDKKIAAIGMGTASYIQAAGFKVVYAGVGGPEITAAEFELLAQNQKVLFPRAKYSEMSVQNLVKRGILCHDLVVYENEYKPQKLDFHPDLIIFTSPRNVKGFLLSNQISQDQKVISIGPTTSKALVEAQFTQFAESRTPNEMDLLELIQTVILE